MNADLLRIHIETVVHLKIAELERWQEPILITDAVPELERIAKEIAEKGDTLQFGGAGAGQLSSDLAWALAILAFLPNGVNFMGLHFEAKQKKGA